jgi:hypothetical protein
MWKIYFCQLFNAHGAKDIRQTEIRTAELLASEPSCFEVEIAIEKLESYKSLSTDQILAELIQAGCNIFRSEINKLINSI